MNTIEIMCEACDTKMRLSGGLLERLGGRRGRVTCKQCSNKVSLDASGDELVVTAGGSRIEGDDLELEPISENDPHLSDVPPANPSLGRIQVSSNAASSLPPPLPQSAAERGKQEAPLPPMRAVEDSLSPHTFEDEASLAALAKDIRSTPFSAPPPRDESYQSLYPEIPAPARKQEVSTPFGASQAPSPPRASSRAVAPAPLFSEGASVGVAPGAPSVVVTADGRLLNQADLGLAGENSKSSKAPWILAAVALFALGISLSAQIQNGVSDAFRPQISSAAASPVPTQLQSLPAEKSETTVAEVMIDAETTTDVREDSPSETDSGADVAGATPAVAPSKSQATSRVKASPATKPSPSAAAPVSAAPAAAAPAAAVEAEAKAEPEEPELQAAPFSAAQAAGAMREATALASSCRRATDPSGQARVVVTFAPSGRVTRATISGPPFAGTTTGGCIASRFRGARIPAFSGEAVTVSKTVTVH